MGEMNAACILEQLQKRDQILNALAQSYAKGLQYLAPISSKYDLVETKLPENSQRNSAFLILLARDADTARQALAAMIEKGIPATLCSKQDAHTGDVWADFMTRAKVPHRVEALEDSLAVLSRAVLLEVAPDMA
jgi:dTDP-4-amino-4,6-dideoxygalactose transaminase